MAKEFSEDLLIQKSTAELLEQELRWISVYAFDNEVLGKQGYNYVQEYWQKEIKALRNRIEQDPWKQEIQEMKHELQWMEETEMAVVVSQEQNEIQTFKKWRLDITPHREKMKKRELDKEFKNSDCKLQVVFVCAMWLTGFDVKTLSCLYINKPMKEHPLMQTIVLTNRVAEGKSNGLVIYYIVIVKALRQALADYTANPDSGEGGNDPTVNKDELIKNIRRQLTGMDHPFDKPTTCATLIISIRDVLWQALPESSDEESINYFRDTIYNYVCQRYGGVA